MPFPEWSCEICKESYPHSRALKGHIKWVHKTKPSNLIFYLCEIMYKTKYTLARHTNSEEYLKAKTKHIHIKLVHKTKQFFLFYEK